LWFYGAAGERGNRVRGPRFEGGGERQTVKVQNLWESGKTTSERELYFFDNHSQAMSGEKPSSGLKEA